MYKLLLSLLLIFGITSCSKVAQNITDDIKYEFVDVNMEVLQNTNSLIGSVLSGDFKNISKVRIISIIKLKNNNDIDLSLDRLDYSIYLNDIFIGKGSLKQKIVLKSHSTTEISIPLNISLTQLVEQNLSNLISKREYNIKVIATGYLNTKIGKFIIHFQLDKKKIKVKNINYSM